MRAFFVILLIGLPWWLVGCGDDDGSGSPDGGCGNGILESGEACDGSELGGADCLSLGWTLGSLGCTDQCEHDVSGCVGGGPQCGNWVVEWGEECDTTDLGGATCVDAGFTAGELACRPDCTFDPTDCGPPATCGNQQLEAPEECDGAELGGQSCESLGHLSGTLTCLPNCVIDESTCHDAECGDGVREGDEQCDGDDLGPEDCVTFGHSGGVLSCDPYCIVDESQCTD